MIFETHTIASPEGSVLRVDDIVETVNHFRCIDYVIDHAKDVLTEGLIKRLRQMLNLAHDIVPFIIDENLRFFYYRGLREFPLIKGYLVGTCLTAQDMFKDLLDRLKIKYST